MAKFCGKCGNPIEYCTCSKTVTTTADVRSSRKPSISSYSTVAHFDDLTLGEGERMVKEYLLGKYPFGCGKVQLFITNKRVILKEAYSFLLLSHNRIEELNLESVHGLNGNIGRGMNRIVFFIGLILLVGSMFIGNLFSGMLYSSYSGMSYSPYRGGGPSIPLLILGLVIMALSCIFPYMTFGIIGTGSDHQSLLTGINVNGKTALNRGVVLQPRPTADARKSIAEAGACIFDLRTYGDEAIEKWTRS